MKQVEIYTTPTCGYCRMAKNLLSQKGVAFIEYDVAADPTLRPKMVARAAGSRTVPQIFIDDTHIGGCDDLYALERTGKLDPILAA
ncbi:glutaredoxin 3 [Paroceanicella profunda]|uniref:Glutaredoxin n=1 Tax=Paroceanicella profunda TaxID=2579971 RepID=A0A5B8FWU7_9RHOB|nr:glutaredoxin 3 [Paroceanicella profunda]QDL92034.1 glutaredoxin 3 [Paroceanicella profunda]